jgi:hypothetical protein
LSFRQRLSDIALPVALVAAIAILLGSVNIHYPVREWLAWHYLWVWCLAAVWALGCLSFGYFLLDRLRIDVGARDVEAALAFPVGVFAFQTSVFLVGLAGLLNGVTFVLLPLAFLAAGRQRLWAALQRFRALDPPRTARHLAVTIFGLAGLAIVYFQILNPEALHWDARWYHLPLGQQYAIRGAVRAFPEGWWLDGQPHEASLLYAWAFLLPVSMLFDRLELCMHIEFVTFVATLASIPVLVRQLVPKATGRGAWAALFLFPGIFLYDSNLAGAADHIAALICIPLTISLIRFWKSWSTRDGILFGVFMAAGLVAKYSVWSMLFFPGIVFVVRALWLVVRRFTSPTAPRLPILLPFVVTGAVMLLLSGQHWLKNWIFYGDPLYPVLYAHLPLHPWNAESPASYDIIRSFTFPPRPGVDGVLDALKTTVNFAFIPNDWPVFHRNVPVFGFLFTLTALCLPFVGAGVPLWAGYLASMVAIIPWYLTSHQDRYLQAWLPLMVACTVGTVSLAWQRGQRMVRALIVVLVGLQVIWGGDIPFFPTHNLLNDSPIRAASNFLASGFLKTPDRFLLFKDEGATGDRLPQDATLLLHELNLQVGFDRRVVNDQWQGLISYGLLGNPAAIHRQLAALKVTHMVWESGKVSGWNSLASDLAFINFSMNHGQRRQTIGQLTLALLPAASPPEAYNDRVALLGCSLPFRTGYYRLRQLSTVKGQSTPEPEGSPPDVVSAVREAGFLVVDPRCTTLPPEAANLFHPPVVRGNGLQLYARRSGA